MSLQQLSSKPSAGIPIKTQIESLTCGTTIWALDRFILLIGSIFFFPFSFFVHEVFSFQLCWCTATFSKLQGERFKRNHMPFHTGMRSEECVAQRFCCLRKSWCTHTNWMWSLLPAEAVWYGLLLPLRTCTAYYCTKNFFKK